MADRHLGVSLIDIRRANKLDIFALWYNCVGFMLADHVDYPDGGEYDP